MRRAHRPIPITVPPSEASSDFKLTDSGVFEQGGIVISKTGCIISKTTSSSPDQTAAKPGSTCGETPCSCKLAPCSLSSATTGAATDAAIDPSTSVPAATPCSSTASGNCNTPGSKGTPKRSSCSGTDSPSSSGRSSSTQAAIALDDLQELAVIGRGSSGIVKKVLHKPSGGVYVLKVINFDMGCEQVRRQVTTEVKAMDGARHPHIVAYHQSYFANGAMTILMEFMDGGSLWDVLQRHKCIPEPYLPELARQVLLGLSHLHDAVRICHRDIKPGNLLLSSDGQLKISDFGVSSQLSNSMSKCLSWVGTVTYMSPERIQGHSYGFNTDVWSLGLLLLECAVGRYPYPPEGETGAGQQQRLGFWELLEYIVVEPAPRLPAGQFSAELVDFVSQCLQKDAAKRPSATEMLHHPFVTKGGKANLSDLLGPAPAKAAGRNAAMRGSTVGSSAAVGGSSRRPASAGSAAPGSRTSSQHSSGGVASISRSSSMRGSYGGGTAAGAAALRHSSALVGHLAPYTSTYQLPRPASGSTAKVCTPPKQQPQQQQQRASQLRQQLHPDLQQHLLSRLQVAPQPQLMQLQRPLTQRPGQIAGQQHARQQQQQQQRQQMPQQPSPSKPLAAQAALQQQHHHVPQQQQQHRPVQQLSQQQQQQHRALTQPTALQQTPPKSQQPAPVSSGPLTALKPTPRKAPVAPPVRTMISDIGA